jgi:hypothetical protein
MYLSHSQMSTETMVVGFVAITYNEEEEAQISKEAQKRRDRLVGRVREPDEDADLERPADLPALDY